MAALVSKNSDIETRRYMLEEETDGFASVEACRAVCKCELQLKLKIDINPMMILFTMPLREGKHEHGPPQTMIMIILRGLRFNYTWQTATITRPIDSKLDEITNNILGNPCGAKNAHRKNFNSDMEFVFIYADKVSPMCIKH